MKEILKDKMPHFLHIYFYSLLLAIQKAQIFMQENESVIRDNYNKGKVVDFLKNNIQQPNAELSIVSAFFTMQAYIRLKDKLDKIKSLRFLFGEPNFLKIDDSKEKKAFRIEQDKLNLSNALAQKSNAKACYDWIKAKVEIKSMVKPDFLHGKLYHIQNDGNQEPHAILGSSNFMIILKRLLKMLS